MMTGRESNPRIGTARHGASDGQSKSAEALGELLTQRFGPVDSGTLARVQGLTERQIKTLRRRALTVRTLGELGL